MARLSAGPIRDTVWRFHSMSRPAAGVDLSPLPRCACEEPTAPVARMAKAKGVATAGMTSVVPARGREVLTCGFAARTSATGRW